LFSGLARVDAAVFLKFWRSHSKTDGKLRPHSLSDADLNQDLIPFERIISIDAIMVLVSRRPLTRI